jgi:hypothetical protein
LRKGIKKLITVEYFRNGVAEQHRLPLLCVLLIQKSKIFFFRLLYIVVSRLFLKILVHLLLQNKVYLSLSMANSPAPIAPQNSGLSQQ